MKHLRPATKEQRPEMAQNTVCGWLFVRTNVKCVDSDSPLAGLLKAVPIE